MKPLFTRLAFLTAASLALAAAPLLQGCAANDLQVQTEAVQARAGFDFRCPRVDVRYLSGDLFVVTGCGKSGVYNANGRCSERSNCEAVREPDGTTSEK